jgi:hypothetical protein
MSSHVTEWQFLASYTVSFCELLFFSFTLFIFLLILHVLQLVTWNRFVLPSVCTHETTPYRWKECSLLCSDNSREISHVIQFGHSTRRNYWKSPCTSARKSGRIRFVCSPVSDQHQEPCGITRRKSEVVSFILLAPRALALCYTQPLFAFRQ